MSDRERRYYDRIRATAEVFHGTERAIRRLEEYAEEDPVLTCRVVRGEWLASRKRWATVLAEQFGFDVIGSRFSLELRIRDEQYTSQRILGRRLEFAEAAEGILLANSIYLAMELVLTHYRKEQNWTMDEAARKALAVAFSALRLSPLLLAPKAVGRDHLVPQEVGLGMLAGWVRSRIRLYPELKQALASSGDDPAEALLRELPGGVLVELGELEARIKASGLANSPARFGVYAQLANRVSSGLRRTSGGSAQRGEPKEPPGGEDVDISSWELAETARQELDALEQVAGLSEQQTSVWHSARRGMEIAEISAELGIPENQVSVQKHNAIKKLKEARKAAGF